MTDKPSPTPVEIELKLRASPDAIDGLADRMDELVPGAGAPVAHRLVTVYFDTADLALARAGISLRLRREGRRHWQSVKARHVPGTIRRHEWEWPIAGRSLDLERLRQGELAAIIPASILPQLAPIFTTDVTRTVFNLRTDDGGKIELALDRGSVTAGDGKAPRGSTPISEVELELKAAPDEATGAVRLYETALDLHGAVPLMIATESKADLGYALVSHRTPSPAKAPKLALAPDIAVGEGMTAIIRACFLEILANQAPTLAGDIEGVHQMRVGLRRLRGAFKLFRQIIGRTAVAQFNRDLKWLSGELGTARDWDVFATTTLDLAKPEGGPDFARVVDAARRRQRAAREALTDALRSPRYTSLMLRLGAWIEGAGWQAALGPDARKALAEPLSHVGDRLLARLARKAAKAGRGISHLDDAERHELRKAVKPLRYGISFLGSLHSDEATKDYRRQLAELQDVLGVLNDLAVGRRLVMELGRSAARRAEAERIAAAFDRCLAKSLDSLPKAWHRFTKVTPFWA